MADCPDYDLLMRLAERLSDEECRVMECVAQGCTRAQTAERLSMSTTTVDRIIQRVRVVLGANNTTAAASWLAVIGKIEPIESREGE